MSETAYLSPPTFVCSVKIERGKKWEHCPEKVVASFMDGADRVELCERCERNVRWGHYGARLRDLLIKERP